MKIKTMIEIYKILEDGCVREKQRGSERRGERVREKGREGLRERKRGSERKGERV